MSVRAQSLVLPVVVATLIFALSYYIVIRTDPDQFQGLATRVDLLYFSVAVVTTTGFGDVAASEHVGRALVTGQMVFNLVIIAIVGSLLSRCFADRRNRSTS